MPSEDPGRIVNVSRGLQEVVPDVVDEDMAELDADI